MFTFQILWLVGCIFGCGKVKHLWESINFLHTKQLGKLGTKMYHFLSIKR